MSDLSAGIKETSASTQEVTNSTHHQTENIKQLIFTDEIVEFSNWFNNELSQFRCN